MIAQVIPIERGRQALPPERTTTHKDQTLIKHLEDPAFRELVSMLEYKRPHGSSSERKFINRFIRTLPIKWNTDDYGNLYGRIGDAPRILWCAHTDSVHSTAGKQRVTIAPDGVHLELGAGQGGCLGADNASGVWMLMQMIRAEIPGLYCFFRNEERGRVGSEFYGHAAVADPTLIEGIDIAIAFDRHGTGSIITEQMVGRTCSNQFAVSLADALKMGHVPDDRGVYTDTASFAFIISECTNVSIGYYNEHTAQERQNVPYLFALRDAVLAADFSDLVVVRDQLADLHEYENGHAWYKAYGKTSNEYGYGSSSGEGWMADDDGVFTKPSAKAAWDDDDATDDDWMPGRTSNRHRKGLLALIKDHPEAVAAYLEDLGVSAAALAEDIDAANGWTTSLTKRYA